MSKLSQTKIDVTPATKSKKGVNISANDSLAIGALWGLGSIVHPCPLCILTSSAFLLNGVRQKIGKL